MISWECVFSPETFEKLADRYRIETSYGLIFITNNKIHMNRCSYYPWQQAGKQKINFTQMIQESLRWGDPCITLDTFGNFVWCVPVCLNERLAGGIFSAVDPDVDEEEQVQSEKVGKAALKLLDLACKQNVCNRSLMQLNREESKTNAHKAEVIHSLKENLCQQPREIYLIEEFDLLSAIRNGNKEEAREIINKILIGVYNLGKENFDVLKTLVLEMVVLMYRAAVDNGADPRELLGVNSSYLKNFHEIKDDIDLSHWLTRWLEAFISTSLELSNNLASSSISLALEYIKNNLGQPITRDEVAKTCNMSPGYFSRIFREKTGYTFTHLLNKFRIEHACSLLDETSSSAYEIAFNSGFNDQSYFNKVFRKYRGKTPLEYRLKS